MVTSGTLKTLLVLLSLLAGCVCVLGHGVVLNPLGQTTLLGTQRDIARTTAINTKLPRRLAAGAGGTLRWVEAETKHGARRLHQAEEEEEEQEEQQEEEATHHADEADDLHEHEDEGEDEQQEEQEEQEEATRHADEADDSHEHEQEDEQEEEAHHADETDDSHEREQEEEQEEEEEAHHADEADDSHEQHEQEEATHHADEADDSHEQHEQEEEAHHADDSDNEDEHEVHKNEDDELHPAKGSGAPGEWYAKLTAALNDPSITKDPDAQLHTAVATQQSHQGGVDASAAKWLRDQAWRLAKSSKPQRIMTDEEKMWQLRRAEHEKGGTLKGWRHSEYYKELCSRKCHCKEGEKHCRCHVEMHDLPSVCKGHIHDDPSRQRPTEEQRVRTWERMNQHAVDRGWKENVRQQTKKAALGGHRGEVFFNRMNKYAHHDGRPMESVQSLLTHQHEENWKPSHRSFGGVWIHGPQKKKPRPPPGMSVDDGADADDASTPS
ncbi:hypothetical protein NFJ02_01g41120 [Pycnococcus provasolii]